MVNKTEYWNEPCFLFADGLIVCHLPFGPTAYFTLSNVVMRHDIPDVGTMSEQFPHLIFHNFSSKLGNRVKLLSLMEEIPSFLLGKLVGCFLKFLSYIQLFMHSLVIIIDLLWHIKSNQNVIHIHLDLHVILKMKNKEQNIPTSLCISWFTGEKYPEVLVPSS